MKKVDVSLWTKKQSLCEIYQLIGMQYAFLSPKNEQCHPWIKCRDFLHDALRSFVTGKKESIYGFSYATDTNPPMNLEKMRILVKRQPTGGEKNASENTKEMMDSAMAILHCMENYGGIKPLSEIYRTTKDKDIYIFEGASDWMESTFMISLYTFLIRLGGKKLVFKDKKDLNSKLKDLSKSKAAANDNDISYLKTVLPFIDKILKKRKELKYVRKDGTRLFDNQTVNIFHNYTGIVALSQQAAKKKSSVTNDEKLKELTALSELIKE